MRYVVAGALLRTVDGRTELLLAQRDYPAEVAGLWELPGGKVEEGETPGAALVRELDEELGVTVVAGERLDEQAPLRADLTLIALWATLRSGVPHAHEHRALRWVGHDALAALADRGEMVPADTVWLGQLLDRLRPA